MYLLSTRCLRPSRRMIQTAPRFALSVFTMSMCLPVAAWAQSVPPWDKWSDPAASRHHGGSRTYSVSGTVTGSAATVTLSGVSSASTIIASGASYTFSGLANGIYIVNVSASGLTFSPSFASVTISSASVTGVNFTAAAVPLSVSLSWTASTSPGVSGYNVFRSTGSGGPYKQINSSLVTGTSYVDNSIVAGNTYYYTATAVNSAGVQSGYSNQAPAAVP